MGRFDLQPRKPKKGAAPPPAPTTPPSPTLEPSGAPKVRPARGRPVSGGKSFMQGFWRGMLAFVAAGLFAIGAALIAYAIIAEPLPDPDTLSTSASSFQSLRILDRNGNLLTESFDTNDPNAGRRTVVPINEISPFLLQATVATEDANFYNHPGVDPVALLRALYYAVIERDIVSGASTIPQQLVKMIFLSPEQTLSRKVKEAILSTEVSRSISKEKILELYLNEVFYGNLAYGIDAASHTYFDKDASELTLAEASLLAGIPQLPATYDPYTNPDAAKNRQSVVLSLMVESDYITPAEADAAYLEPLVYAPLSFDMKYPHFTLYVRQQLEARFAEEEIYKLGLEVSTTLDPDLQDAAEAIVAEQVGRLADRNVSNGALVAMRPTSGEIVAFVGSADFDNVEIDGQVNMALAPRQPGSSIKPLVYLASFEQPEKPVSERWTPGTLIADIKQEFPDGANPPYIPTNYDLREHGMVTVRTALANSYNIPAVRAMQTVELPDFLELTRRLGITTLTRPDYGLSLSLGGGEVPLIEMTGAFGVLANGGKRVPPVAILKVTDSGGNILCEQGTSNPCQPSSVVSGQQVVSAVDAFLITDILSDNAARALAFGPNSVLQLDRPAAVKTGTTNDFRDNLTLGYTPQLVTGVWIGNANNSEMRDISGVSGAGPIWGQFMTFAHSNQPVEQFIPPAGVRQFEVCADTGTMPSEACPERRQHWFAEDRPPLPADRDLYQIVRFDRNSGQLANEFTPGDAIEEKVFKVYPPEYRQWAEEHGVPQPPASPEDVYEFTPELHVRQPVEGEVVSGRVPIFGSANAPGFRGYELHYGVSHDPGAFSAPFAGSGAPVLDGLLGEWDTSTLSEGPHTIRLVVYGENNAIFEQRVRVFVAAATPTPEATMTWTPPPPPIDTAIPEVPPTDTPLPTDTVVVPPTEIPPVDTPLPTDTVVAPPIDTPIPVDTVAPPVDTPLPVDTPVILETPTITPSLIITAVAPAEAVPSDPTATWTAVVQ